MLKASWGEEPLEKEEKDAEKENKKEKSSEGAGGV